MCNFLISSWSSMKVGTNSQQKKFQLLTKYFCVKQTSFGMVHFMAKWSNFYNLLATLVNITPKPDVLKKNKLFFSQIFWPFCLGKMINFTSTFYESLKF